MGQGYKILNVLWETWQIHFLLSHLWSMFPKKNKHCHGWLKRESWEDSGWYLFSPTVAHWSVQKKKALPFRTWVNHDIKKIHCSLSLGCCLSEWRHAQGTRVCWGVCVHTSPWVSRCSKVWASVFALQTDVFSFLPLRVFVAVQIVFWRENNHINIQSGSYGYIQILLSASAIPTCISRIIIFTLDYM